jgi:hypothetical protein
MADRCGNSIETKQEDSVMKISRREVTKILLAAAVAPPGIAANAVSQTAAAKTWDVAVIGAGVFGAWSHTGCGRRGGV